MSAPLRWVGHAAGTGLGRRYPFMLCYHGVGTVPAARDPNRIFMSRELFSEHLDVIEGRGYEMLGVSDLWRSMRDGAAAHGRGAITFDDGLRTTVEQALPLLAQRGMPSSMFVPTGLMGKPHPDLLGEMIIDRSEVQELARAGVEIGAHTVDHVHLTAISYAEAVEQMRRSREVLEDLLGAPVLSMAYPFGAYDEAVMRAAAEAGYETACACSGPGAWSPLRLPREPVHSSATPLRLRLKMAGLYGPAYALVGDHGPLHRRRAEPASA